MPRVHFVKKARKANKNAGIKKGDSYYWWKHRLARSSIKRISKTKPRPSQLTDWADEAQSIVDSINWSFE